MLSDPLFVLVVISVLAVLVILAIGIGGFAKGGEFNKRHSNRMMRYRIAAQAIAVVLIVLFVVIRGAGGN